MARTRGNKRLCALAQDATLPPTREIASPSEGDMVDWGAYFDVSRRVEVDVGCGKGRFLLARARQFPETQFLGLERQDARVARIDVTARREGLCNVRLLKADAMRALCVLLPPACADTVYFFFPDPWPKRKHHKHRLFSPAFLDALVRLLKSQGCLHVATDRPDYGERMATLLDGDPRFRRIATFERTPEEYTDFELLFRAQGLPVHAASYQRV